MTINEATKIRIIELKESFDEIFKVKDYLVDGTLFFEGDVAFINSDFPCRYHKYYYPDGSIKIEGLYSEHKRKMTEKIWYKNGKLRCEQQITGLHDKIFQAYDSSGRSTLKNGTGKAELEDFNSNTIWKGNVKNFTKDSIWVGYNKTTQILLYKEHFKNGYFEKGITKDKNGTTDFYQPYIEVEENKLNVLKKEIKTYLKPQLQKMKPGGTKHTFTLFFKDGILIKVKQLIKNTNEVKLDLSGFNSITPLVILERGRPKDFCLINIEL